MSSNATKAPARWTASTPPPDEIQQVRVAPARPRAQAMSDGQGERGSGLRTSAPPPDEIQDVRIAPPLASQQAETEPHWRTSAPPPDEIQDVRIAPPLAAASARNLATSSGQETTNHQTTSVEGEINAFLSFKEVDYATDIGTAPDEEHPVIAPAAVSLDNQEMYQIIREVAFADSGDALYSAISADREFDTPGQLAYQRRHFGLAFGLVLVTQESGHLGSLLTIMQRRDAALFSEIFGEYAAELLAVTNAATPEARLQPVGGQNLWSESWVARFRSAAEIPTFQAAQNEEAIENLFQPILPVVTDLGFVTDRGLAMCFDRVVTRGVGAGLRWIVGAAGALRTAAQRESALRILGYASIGAFQAASGWLPQDGQFGPETHAALVGELRRRDWSPLPTAAELMRRLVEAAGGAARNRLLRLRDSKNLDDVTYNFE